MQKILRTPLFSGQFFKLRTTAYFALTTIQASIRSLVAFRSPWEDRFGRAAEHFTEWAMGSEVNRGCPVIAGGSGWAR